jgi:hypothetical protein
MSPLNGADRRDPERLGQANSVDIGHVQDTDDRYLPSAGVQQYATAIGVFSRRQTGSALEYICMHNRRWGRHSGGATLVVMCIEGWRSDAKYEINHHIHYIDCADMNVTCITFAL